MAASALLSSVSPLVAIAPSLRLEFQASRVRLLSCRRRRTRAVRCQAKEEEEEESGGGFEVKEQVEQILQNAQSKKLLDSLAEKVMEDEESKALLKDLAAATERVEKVKLELERTNRQEQELLFIENAIARAIKEQNSADATVAEVENDVLEAEEAVRAAERALVTARAGASSTKNSIGETEEINKDLERIESGKAAAVSAMAGTLASLPFLVTSGGELGIGSLLSVGGVIASCALYGVTYRYILRRDLGNVHLKSGAAAAFALVRGIGAVDAVSVQVGFPAQGVEQVMQAALNASESIFIFSFATVAMDFCLREALLSPYPMKKS